MMQLLLVGIGCGNPHYLTREAERALRAADVILLPRKGQEKAGLMEARTRILNEIGLGDSPALRAFDMPLRDGGPTDYRAEVDRWHDAIADAWDAALHDAPGRVALMVWGDASLYDSTLRIADRLAARRPVAVTVIPGITSVQALTAGHAIPLNTIGDPVVLTTGRRLREDGWPGEARSVVVMLDSGGAFGAIPPEGVHIWWTAYAGLPEEIRLSGPLGDIADDILAARKAARDRHGWIMDVYLLRKTTP